MKNKRLYNNLFWVIMFLMPIHLISWDPITKNITLGCVGLLLLRSIMFTLGGYIHIHNLINQWAKALIFTVLIAFVYIGLSCPFDIGDISLVTIPLALTFSSYCLFTQDDETMEKFIFVFSIVSAICAIIILMRSGGFTIVDLYRENVLKNAVAPFYCQVGVLALSSMINSKNKYKITVYVAVFAICLIQSIVLRARTAMLALVAASLILLYNKFRGKAFIYLFCISFVAFFFWGDQIVDILYASVVGGNKDLYDIDSLTSGRAERNELAIQYILQNPLWGASTNNSLSGFVFSDNYLVPHNFILYTLVKYGFFGSVAFLYIYWLLVKQVYLHYKEANLLCLGCLLIALAVSLAEYCSPFGPGTTYIITYLILGRTLKVSEKEY